MVRKVAFIYFGKVLLQNLREMCWSWDGESRSSKELS